MKYTSSGSACRVEINKKQRVIYKSAHKLNQGIENGHDKLLNEALFIKKQAKNNNFYPRVLDVTYKNEDLVVEYEYLFDGVTLADLIFDDNLSQAYIDNSLEFVINRLFNEYYIPKGIVPDDGYLNVCYFNRLRRRMDVTLELIETEFGGWIRLKDAILNGVVLNGSYYPGIYEYLNYLERDTKLHEILMINRNYESHHDLIPENIVVNATGKLNRIAGFKLIDPRGEFETGENNRHYVYDMGKMFFGLDCYGLFRKGFFNNDFSHFSLKANEGNDYVLMFNNASVTVKHLIDSQKTLWNVLGRLRAEFSSDWEKRKLQYLFSFSFMYLPDIPCRIIAEKEEMLAIAFYTRGMMIMRNFMIAAYGRDPLSSNATSEVDLWPMRGV